MITSALSSGNSNAIWMYSHAFDVIGVAQIVSLGSLLRVEQNSHGRHKVDTLASLKLKQIRATIFATIAVDPF